jgi:hypothetical protein
MSFSEFGTERGTPIRMPSSSILGISSADRFKNLAEARAGTTTPYDFTIQKNENIMAGSITRLALTEFVLPWNLPNVNNINNKIIFYFQSTDPVSTVPFSSYTITIPPGWYDGTSLANMITQILGNSNTGSPLNPANANLYTWITNAGWQIFYTASIGNFIANSTVNGALYTFQFVPYVNPQTPNVKNVFDMMNWAFNGTLPISGGMAQYQSSGVSPMITTEYVDVICDQITYNQELRDSTSQPQFRDMLARIYLKSPLDGNQVPLTQYFVASSSYSTSIPTNAFPPTPVPTGASTSMFPAVLGTAPFIIYRQFSTPKYVKWSGNQNIPGFMRFQLVDDQGNVLTSGPNPNLNPTTGGSPFFDYNMPDWQMTLLVSET